MWLRCCLSTKAGGDMVLLEAWTLPRGNSDGAARQLVGVRWVGSSLLLLDDATQTAGEGRKRCDRCLSWDTAYPDRLAVVVTLG